MPQPKGSTGNPKGRPKGSKNERSLQWEALGDAIITQHAGRFNEFLSTVDDQDFAKYFIMVLEHFKPKLSRSEQKVEGSNELIVKVIRK